MPTAEDIRAVAPALEKCGVRRAWALASEPQKEFRMDIDIKRKGSRPSQKGSEDWFTGTVRVDPLFQAPEPAPVGAGQVTFEPGARTAWHTHPLGQTLIVTAGLGWVQREAGPIEDIRPGDVVWFPPGLKHWARRFAHHGDDTHRRSGIRRWQERRLDGEGVFVFEMYTDVDAYKSHLETAHFKKYKATTKDMVKSLKLRDAVPILLGTKSK
jgi:quercetin dioxygenase-like cupin family protein